MGATGPANPPIRGSFKGEAEQECKQSKITGPRTCHSSQCSHVLPSPRRRPSRSGEAQVKLAQNESGLCHRGYFDEMASWSSLATAQCGGFINKQVRSGGRLRIATRDQWRHLFGPSPPSPPPKKAESMRKQLPRNQNQSWVSTQHNNGRRSRHMTQCHVMKADLFFQWTVDSAAGSQWWLGSVPPDGLEREAVSKWWASPMKVQLFLEMKHLTQQ